MNLGEKYKKAWFDYMSNLDRETLPSLMDDKFKLRSLTKGPQKTIETKQEILERISNIGTSIKLIPEIYYSSDDLLVISVLQEWDTGKGIVMWFVKFRDGKAIQQITAKGDPA